ncbi:hypothetical protein I7I51_08599 [Histoplasma capsulatum]|uniref:Uncharacterized protein n=1 Tax=Ajellomyces capsulatus TaxID=5037 RepID=A0A8A1M4P3_AJECA|nr:hypothetical protein I7I51_08599 [Histoplasma capsulatum]
MWPEAWNLEEWVSLVESNHLTPYMSIKCRMQEPMVRITDPLRGNVERDKCAYHIGRFRCFPGTEKCDLRETGALDSHDGNLSWLMREPSIPNLPIYAVRDGSALRTLLGGLAGNIHFWLKSLWHSHAIVKTLTSSFDPLIVVSSFQAGRARFYLWNTLGCPLDPQGNPMVRSCDNPWLYPAPAAVEITKYTVI